jgi:hypothetical protein
MRPGGGWGRCGGRTVAGSAARTAARNAASSTTRASGTTTRYTGRVFGLFRRQDRRFRDDGDALWCRVRTSRHGELIRVRLSKTSEMSTAGRGYFVRKQLIGPNTLDQATLEVETDRGHKVLNAVVEGGDLVPVAEWTDDNA